MSLTISFAVEKVLFRLALQEGGVVPISRLFLELPLSLEEVEEHADGVADGISVVKNEWGEFLTYEFPELSDPQSSQLLDDCPLCGQELPLAPTEGGQEVRRVVVCVTCYGRVLQLASSKAEEGRLERLKEFFFGEEDNEDPHEVALLEHELYFIGLRLGEGSFTSTTMASQSRHPASKIKARLDKMAARRYLHMGLLPSGDAVGYRFPADLTYPRSHYKRLDKPKTTGKIKGLKVEPEKPRSAPRVQARKKTGLKIVIKERRSRNP